ncbi:hypothetical protein [Burkholderia phage vB_BglM_WTB]
MTVQSKLRYYSTLDESVSFETKVEAERHEELFRISEFITEQSALDMFEATSLVRELAAHGMLKLPE